MATAPSIDHDQKIIDIVIADLARPKGVLAPKPDFGEDHTGDPAVWLSFPVDDRVALTDKRARELAEFSLAVSRALYDRHLDRIPYVRFTKARRRVSAR